VVELEIDRGDLVDFGFPTSSQPSYNHASSLLLTLGISIGTCWLANFGASGWLAFFLFFAQQAFFFGHLTSKKYQKSCKIN
jgi:hypothetical protein